MKDLFTINSNDNHNHHFSHGFENGFFIAEKSNEVKVTWTDLLEKLETKDTKLNLLEYIPTHPEENLDDSSDIPDWFKNRARLWSQERIGDNVFFSGIDQLFRKGVIGVS